MSEQYLFGKPVEMTTTAPRVMQLAAEFQHKPFMLTPAEREQLGRLVKLAFELECSLNALYGAKFSDRCYHALKSRAETNEADAARYRWLRDRYYDYDGSVAFYEHDKGIDYKPRRGQSLDAAVDEAMSEPPKKDR